MLLKTITQEELVNNHARLLELIAKRNLNKQEEELYNCKKIMNDYNTFILRYAKQNCLMKGDMMIDTKQENKDIETLNVYIKLRTRFSESDNDAKRAVENLEKQIADLKQALYKRDKTIAEMDQELSNVYEDYNRLLKENGCI